MLSSPLSSLFSSSASSWSSRDTEQYLAGYPNQKDDLSLNDNLRFYSNAIPSRPNGDLVEVIHEEWWGNYRRLEVHHGYIQWLFPLREEGMNSAIHPLQLHELRAIRADPACIRRLQRSYALILDFWGFELADEETGEVRMVADERVRNLVQSTHNYLRVTRVLKSLGEFGLERWKLGFGLRLWAVAKGPMGRAGMRRSCEEYWLRVLKDEGDRRVVEEVSAGQWDVTDEAVYRQLLSRRAEERATEGGSVTTTLHGDDEHRQGEEREQKRKSDRPAAAEPVKRHKANDAADDVKTASDEPSRESGSIIKEVGSDETPHESNGGKEGDDGQMTRAMSLVEADAEESKGETSNGSSNGHTSEENRLKEEL